MRRKLHVKKGKEESFSDKKRGFTLIELLAVIVIIGAIGGIVATAIISIINNSKENATELAINNVKSAAELYSRENSSEIEWIQQYDNNGNETGKFVCMTVRQLINNGYFDEDFFKEDIYHDRLNDNTYIEIKQGVNSDNTKVTIHEDDITQNDCEMSAINSTLSNINIDDKESFTDRLNFDATPSEDEVGDVTFFATYEKDNIESSNIDCTNGKCLFENLEDNTGYKIKICMRPNEGNTTLKNTVCEYFGQATEAFTEPTIKIENANKWKRIKKVTITYDDTGIYNEKGIHYFKSEVNATFVSGKIYKCDNFENGKNNTCNSAVTANGTITEGTWYKVEGEKVEFNVATHLGKGNSKVITARIQDQTGNYIDSKENIIRIDTKPPTCISSGGNNSWTNKDVILTGTCSDEDSGCSKKTITKPVDYSAQGAVEVGEVRDKAGNKATCPTRNVLVDKDPPVCDTYGGNTKWINSGSITITATCTDTGGSDCNYSTLPKSNPYTTDINTDKAGPLGDKKGGRVYDNAGNYDDCPTDQTVKIDKTKPYIKLNGTNDNYNLSVSFSDSGSGIKSSSWGGGVASVSINGTSGSAKSNGGGSNASFTVIDNAGNSRTEYYPTYKYCTYNGSSGNAKVYKWGAYQSRECGNKVTDKIRKYNFRVGDCTCSVDKYNTSHYCGGYSFSEITQISHDDTWNGSHSTAVIHYQNNENGKKACKNELPLNSYVARVCTDSGAIAGGGTFYHGYTWYSGAVGAVNDFSANSFYHNVKSHGVTKFDSSIQNFNQACNAACSYKYNG